MMGCREDTGSLEGGRAQRGGQSILRPQQEPLIWAGGGLAQSSGLWLGREGEEGIWAGAGGRALGCRWQALPREMMAVLYLLAPWLEKPQEGRILGVSHASGRLPEDTEPLGSAKDGKRLCSSERREGRGEGGGGGLAMFPTAGEGAASPRAATSTGHAFPSAGLRREDPALNLRLSIHVFQEFCVHSFHFLPASGWTLSHLSAAAGLFGQGQEPSTGSTRPVRLEETPAAAGGGQTAQGPGHAGLPPREALLGRGQEATLLRSISPPLPGNLCLHPVGLTS